MTPPPILGQDDLIECLRWAAFKMYGAGEHETFASDAITMAIDLIEDLRQPTQSDALQAENAQLRHDLERQMTIANEHVNEVDTLLREIETLRVEALAERRHGYYIGFARADGQNDALREALVDLLHAVCGKTGFAETVRRDSGRIYPWPALDLAEAKAIAALGESK